MGFFRWVILGGFYCQPCLQPAAHQALQADEPQHLVQPPSSRLLARQVFNGLCREGGGGCVRSIRKKLMEEFWANKIG
jgi:hypothetical protein